MGENCIFCMIANGQIAAKTLYEDDDFRIIFDIAPATKGHMLILPKRHCNDITELDDELGGKLLSLIKRAGKASMEFNKASGFNTLINTGAAAGQTVFHCHVHIIPRYDEGEKILIWNPGTYEEAELDGIFERMKEAFIAG